MLPDARRPIRLTEGQLGPFFRGRSSGTTGAERKDSQTAHADLEEQGWGVGQSSRGRGEGDLLDLQGGEKDDDDDDDDGLDSVFRHLLIAEP